MPAAQLSSHKPTPLRPAQRAIVTRLSGNGSYTMASDQRNKGESNEIHEAICCCPGVAYRDRPVPAGDGPEHHPIYHHHFTGSGLSATGPDYSNHEYDCDAGRPTGEADRYY